MARCTNCGREIPEEDKTRLCEDCKRIILPFIKFMDGSDTPAVKRLLSNEKNLRTAGVTDSGMDYLYRICELRDRKARSARESKENSSTAAAFGTPDPTGAGASGTGKKKITAHTLPSAETSSDELSDFAAGRKTNQEQAPQPEDEQNSSGSSGNDGRNSMSPEAGEESPVGRALPAAQWIMILAGTASLIWFGAKILTRTFVGESLTDSIDVGALTAALSSYSGAYVAGAVRKALRRFEP